MINIDLAIKRELNKNFLNIIYFKENQLIIKWYRLDLSIKDFKLMNSFKIDLEKELYELCKKYFIENEKELKEKYTLILI